MKCSLKLFPFLLLAACAGGSGGGNMCTVSPVGKGQSTDGIQSKALFTEREIATDNSSGISLGTNGLTGAAFVTSKGVQQGTELTVTVNDSCQKYGPISGKLN